MNRLIILVSLIVIPILGLLQNWARAAENASCAAMPAELVYAASFQADSGAGKMRLVVGRASAGSELIAQIWSQEDGRGACQAMCRLKSTEEETPFSSRALHLECKSTRLGALSTSMTVLWPKDGTLPQLRFGSWIRGYEHAPLLVEMDRFASATSKLAEGASGGV